EVARKALKSMQRLKEEAFLDGLLDKIIDSEYTVLIQKVLAAYVEVYFGQFRSLFFDKGAEYEIRRTILGILVESDTQERIEYSVLIQKVLAAYVEVYFGHFRSLFFD